MKKITDTVERFLSFIVGVGLICFFSFILLLASAQLNNSTLGDLLARVAGETAKTARTESFSYWGQVGQEIATGLGITGGSSLTTGGVNPQYTPVVVVVTNTPAPTASGNTNPPAPTATPAPANYVRSSALSEGGLLLWRGLDGNQKMLPLGVNLENVQQQARLALAQNSGDLLALWLQQKVNACSGSYNQMVTTPYTDTSQIPTVKAGANALLAQCNPRLLVAYGYLRWSDIALWLAQAPKDETTGLPRPADEASAETLLGGLTIMLGDKDGPARGFRPEDRVRVDVLPISEFGLSSVSMQLSVATLDKLLGEGTWQINNNTAYVVKGAFLPDPAGLPEAVLPTDAELAPPQISAPPAGGVTAPTGGQPSTYTVKAGDTANSIARQFNLTLEALIAANPTTLGVNPNLLQVGDVLNIPAP